MDGCKEICQQQTEMEEKARCPMFQQELEELTNVTEQQLVTDHRQTDLRVCLSMVCHKLLFCYIRCRHH